jgi:hypothetical protein
VFFLSDREKQVYLLKKCWRQFGDYLSSAGRLLYILWSWMAVSVMFLPVCKLLISSIDCTSDAAGNVWWGWDPDRRIQCFQGIHWVYAISALAALIPSVLFSIRMHGRFVDGHLDRVDRWSDVRLSGLDCMDAVYVG